MPEVLWKALGLMLVFEGLMPFLAPESWQQTLRRLSELPPQRLRWFGGAAVVLGLLIVNDIL
ncbi:MAG: DUF2065 domain-containing protein [Tepidiphilus sp.]|jgi:uncharacterized protein YjeT (DUF2065 family)|uniref:Uncharacterized conserved protein YjeT, DUF2065 family n=1 Tax=Tepidiphilus thermophilus TaxID=876478 RepID=A0A0K6IXP7_9PROT|nr:DUF2065 domain-containing protein [Tepidiphilus thermophilus]MBP6998563.1 DUF2065 domain-containing protein [Tepidiphilus sp.]CUB08077.1 Uncharacterized conserved protein YjeT, DUF2065 family [Tepidiphilus thermophilus]